MNNHSEVAPRCALKTLWAVVLLLVSSLLTAQEQDEQDPPEPEATAQGQEASTEDQQDVAEPATPDAQGQAEAEGEAEGQAQSQAQSDIPVQSLTGPLEILVNPEFPPDQARRVYQPLVDFLNDETGLELNLVVDRNFHRYWLNARRNEAPPLILEDAHMVAWRMRTFDYQPLVAPEASKTFSLLTTGAFADDGLQDFIGRRIASLPSPSLGYLVLADWYGNPMQQPLIESTATSWLDAIEMVFSNEADAAIAPNNLVMRYPNLYPVATSNQFPGLTLSASPDVPDDVRRMLIDAMTVLHENEEHHAALFELDIDRFVVADPVDYTGLEQWLSPIFAL